MSPEITYYQPESEPVSPLTIQQRLAEIVDTDFHKPWLAELKKVYGKHHLPFFASKDYKPRWLGESSRKVFFDIEGFPTDDGKNDSFGLASTIDENNEVRLWERHELNEFLDYLLGFDEVVSFAGLGFDNWAISKGVGVDDPRIQELYNKSFDVQQLVRVIAPTKLKHERMSLNTVAKNTVGRSKKDLSVYEIRGEDIPFVLQDGPEELKRLVEDYCIDDTVLARDIYDFYSPNQRQKEAMLNLQIEDVARDIYQAGQTWHLIPPYEDGHKKQLRPGEFEKPISILIGIEEEVIPTLPPLEEPTDYDIFSEPDKDSHSPYISPFIKLVPDED